MEAVWAAVHCHVTVPETVAEDTKIAYRMHIGDGVTMHEERVGMQMLRLTIDQIAQAAIKFCWTMSLASSIVSLAWSIGTVSLATAADRPQWGEKFTRNMVSPETGLPDQFDLETGGGVKWSASVGSRGYSTPVISQGRVLVGGNNDEPRDPRQIGDRGVLFCLDEQDGHLHWQLVVPKLQGDVYLDQPQYGICSPATVDGNRVFTVTNRAEVVCLDLAGQANGNDGPYVREDAHQVLPGEQPIPVTDTDADILWLFDMPAEIGMHPHDSAHSSILVHGRYLYLNTGNGVDNTHRKIRSPDAPSLIVLDKETGRLVAHDDEKIGPRIFHCTWSSPSLAEVNGKTLIFFCGGDGVCYAFEALPQNPLPTSIQTLKRVWKFDVDPDAPKEDVHRFVLNRRVSPSTIMGMPVYDNGRIFLTGGGDIWWGKDEAWMKCIDATQTGDVTSSGEVWTLPMKQHVVTTPAIHDGLVFAADCARTLYCADAATGKLHWSQRLNGEVWGSCLVADGKVYIGTRSGDFWIFAASSQKHRLFRCNFDSGIGTTPAAANGVLYVPTLTRLFALQQEN
jgi:outer membrane protein assembly factor BamB